MANNKKENKKVYIIVRDIFMTDRPIGEMSTGRIIQKVFDSFEKVTPYITDEVMEAKQIWQENGVNDIKFNISISDNYEHRMSLNGHSNLTVANRMYVWFVEEQEVE